MDSTNNQVVLSAIIKTSIIWFLLNVLSSAISFYVSKELTDIKLNLKSLRLYFKLKSKKLNKDDIRLSLSYLFRIKINDKYLLIKGNRINQFQPIGGVYKRYPSSLGFFKELDIKDDKCIKIDDKSKNDLRIRVPSKNVLKFLKWYNSKLNREVTVSREFTEELITRDFLPNKSLESFNPEFLKSVQTDLQLSTYHDCHEILIYDIFEINLSDEEIEYITPKIDRNNLILASEDEIKKKNIFGIEPAIKIGEHTIHTI